ncbi:TlpA family protein disulfide reductase [Hymenobacter aerilatus]|uniref:TlpA family protein disulfide reductase n=1 Tax=Hymenobacter aerilatus TaxID=2932251 RepID=A0A8T9SXS1_9BACT|nr:TlpA disulfide reductase family protein [Hymenobacter aerilatus]UOR04579.1 TlpA family protein disulfide reductase [Hymenobacter aerilatus]
MRSSRLRFFLDWLPWLVLAAVVCIPALRVPVVGTLQRGLLATGIMRPTLPETSPAAPAQPTTATGAVPYPDVPLLTLDGRPTNLRALRGKVVFLNLWATWCPPCVAELPSIQALAARVDTQRVAFALVSLDRQPRRAQVFARRQGLTLPIYFPAAPLPAPFETDAIPATFVVTPDGRVDFRHEGMADYDSPKVKSYLEGLAQP